MNGYYAFMDKVFGTDDPNDDYTHVWVGIILLLLIVYLGGLRLAFGSRAM
jgi:hypothetical protein